MEHDVTDPEPSAYDFRTRDDIDKEIERAYISTQSWWKKPFYLFLLLMRGG